MGREKKNKPRGQRSSGAERTWVEDTPEAEPAPDIWINTAPRTAKAAMDGTPPTCLVRWGQLEWYASAEDVALTARDLSTAAAYADLIGAWFRFGLDAEHLNAMLQMMLRDVMGGRPPVMGGMMGSEATLGVMPGGISAQKAGVVLLKRGPMAGSVSPEGAREMARSWLEVSVASRQDELTALAVADLLGVDGHGQVDAVLGYMAGMRELGAKEREDFRREEAERLRLHVGLPPAPGSAGG
ncbi:hypothetical protein [Streptomyces albogriseolus]|uniref:hypothetical protein n=1 Tax=Streptomyces albogriseolus TaxID=1887 RepID=UPI00346026DB